MALPGEALGTTLPSQANGAVATAFHHKPFAAPWFQAGAREQSLRFERASDGLEVIGFYLAKELRELGHDVTIMTVGEESSPKMSKPPFTRFSELRDVGVNTIWGEPSDMAAASSNAFDVVIDNNGKTLQAVQPVADWAKSKGTKQFLFVSSAGIYKPSFTPPILETDPVNENSGHAEVERYLAALDGVEFSSFRPQYIIGSGNNKDCEEFFFDRLVRGRPVLIPGSGQQIVNVAHARDNAHMIALAVGDEAAHGQIFNCSRDTGVTLDGMVELCAKAAGVQDPQIIHYDPDQVARELGIEVKKVFPFRFAYHFFTEPRAALTMLGWTPAGDLASELEERFQEYSASGRGQQDMSFESDDKIIAEVQ
eukprot:gene7651-9115_t